MLCNDMYIGIDLGTTNTVVSIGKINIDGSFATDVVAIPQLDQLRDPVMDKQTLSSVLFVDDDGVKYIGEIGKWMREFRSDRVVSNSKRYIGTTTNWTIGEESINSRDVATEILKVCRNFLCNYLRREVNSATITVPASFNYEQTMDTIEAAVDAGFMREKIYILHEPTAALIDYINTQSKIIKEHREVDFSKEKRILVFDLGGGTCDISIIDVKQEEDKISFKEKAIGRYEDLGGIDFDTWAAEYLLNKFILVNNISVNELKTGEILKMKNNLVIFSEQAKEQISAKISYYSLAGINKSDEDIKFIKSIPEFYKGKMYEFNISKKQYDEATKELYYWNNKIIKKQEERQKYKNIEEPVLTTLENYDISKESIDFIFMTGGMCNYSKVRERMYEILNKPIILAPDPIKAVSKGAAIYKYFNIKEERKNNNEYLKQFIPLKDISYLSENKENFIEADIKKVLAESVMIDVDNGLPEIIIEANQEVPFSGVLKGKLKTTSPSGIKINLYAGKNKYDATMRVQRSYSGYFDHPVKTNTPISIEYNIDDNKYLSMKVIIEDNLRQTINLGITKSDVKISH